MRCIKYVFMMASLVLFIGCGDETKNEPKAPPGTDLKPLAPPAAPGGDDAKPAKQAGGGASSQ